MNYNYTKMNFSLSVLKVSKIFNGIFEDKVLNKPILSMKFQMFHRQIIELFFFFGFIPVATVVITDG